MSDAVVVLVGWFGWIAVPIVAVVLALRWLTPRLVQQALQRNLQAHQSSLDRELEDFKIRLQAETAAKLEIARAEMARASLEHQVRFTRLYERRAQVIAGTYARLDRVHRGVRNLTQAIFLDENKPQGWDEAIKAYRDLQTYYFERAIWLDPDTLKLVNNILDLLAEPFSKLAVIAGRNRDDLTRAIRETNEITNKLVPDARVQLEARFRQILTGTVEGGGSLQSA